MTKFSRTTLMMLGMVGALIARTAVADDESGVDAKAAFAKLKALAGDWKGEAGGNDKATVSYRVTANGSVVMETLFAGTNHEMVTMYHLDGGDLRLTHYCAAGNQPRLKLDKKGSKPDELKFDFDGGTNLDPAKDTHMHSGRIVFRDANRIESSWEGYHNGKPAGVNTFKLSRP